MIRLSHLCIAAFTTALLSCLVAPATAADDRVVIDFDTPMQFAYGAFQDKPVVRGRSLVIKANRDAGGMGTNYEQGLDLSGNDDRSPVLVMTLGPGHETTRMAVGFRDANNSEADFIYDLGETEKGAQVRVFPRGGAYLETPDGVKLKRGAEAFDWSDVRQVQVRGGWRQKPIDVALDALVLAAPTPEVLARREARAVRMAEEAAEAAADAAERRRQQERVLQNVRHTADGPTVTHVGAVREDVLGITIEAGSIENHGQEPYVAQPGDEIRESKKQIPVWDGGKVVEGPKDRTLFRKRGNALVKFAQYFEVDGRPMIRREHKVGKDFTTITADLPEAYRVSSADDPGYATPRQPTAVHRKSKPTDMDDLFGNKPFRHVVYLDLLRPLKEGATYRVEFVGVNTAQPAVSYTHDTRAARSEAIHVNHLGYRPDDPYKRAYLSMWVGDGRGLSFDGLETFELVDDATGEAVFTGDIRLGWAKGKAEAMKISKNFVQADVYYLDFHGFDRPGTYRVHVPGIGGSYPFVIGRDAWTGAFRAAMHGFLVQRSGVELGPPFTDYVRPRPMHPDDGFTVYKIPFTRIEGEVAAVVKAVREAMKPDGTVDLEVHPAAWGGYMDAGDWDRRSQHLDSTYGHIDLYDRYGDFFEGLALALPPDEANDDVPDLLNEAMWNLDCYRRMQEPDGGVGGGIESTAHPRAGEASWQESLVVAAFAPDPLTSFQYAANAAKMGRVLAPYDSAKAELYVDTATRAYDWAVANRDRVIQEVFARAKKINKNLLRHEMAQWAAASAVELYHATGERRFHDAVLASDAFAFGQTSDDRYWLSYFAYAALPDTLATDAAARRQAREVVLRLADRAIDFAGKNAFGITTTVPSLPMMGYVGYYTVPEMVTGPVLPRAHYLTGDEKYLHAAVRAANFSAGANPVNITFTTGVGHDYPREPLHIDARVTGQEPPAGLPVCGMSDPGANFGFNNWVHTWHLQEMVPASRSWPAAEWYVDLYKWPAMNEFTVHQQMGPTSFYWGFLAARGE